MTLHFVSFFIFIATLGLAGPGALAESASRTAAPKAAQKNAVQPQGWEKKTTSAGKDEKKATSAGKDEKKATSAGKDEKKDAAETPALFGDGQTPWQPLPQKNFSKQRKDAECAKYEGKYISSYDNMYRIENCKRRLITNGELTRKITLAHPVYPVKNDTIIMLAEGTPIESMDEKELTGAALCQRLEGEYVTIPGGEIFVVEGCKRRMFPDWETFSEHQKKTKHLIITEISATEMNSLKLGKEIPSIMPAIFKKLLSGSAQVDVIPLNEACRNVNGKLVFYYTHIYKIENCRKREVDAEEYMKRHKYDRFKLPELTSEQWVSLPDGKPMVTNEVADPPPLVEPPREKESVPAADSKEEDNNVKDDDEGGDLVMP